MGDKIRQFIMSILGIGTFLFIFYLVFKENPRFMIISLICLGGLVLIILLVGFVLRVKDDMDHKKRTRPYEHNTIRHR